MTEAATKHAAATRTLTDKNRRPDITLINMNIMLARYDQGADRESYAPLGVLYLIAFLEKHGYNVEFIDYQLFSHADEFNPELFAAAVGNTAEIVGISCMSNVLPFAILTAEQLRHLNPHAAVVLGGVGPSPVAKEIIHAFPFIDSVVTGEGERVLLDFLENGVVSLPEKAPVENLDSLPMPAYHHLDYDLYNACPSIIASRGCPYQCTFCTERHNFDGKVRLRDPAKVCEEIEYIHSLSGDLQYLFQDDNINLNKRHFQSLMTHFRKLSFPFLWKAFSRVDIIDLPMMKEMVETGCTQIRYGIESGSNKTLNTLRKGFTIEKAYETVAQSAEIFPSVHVSFMWGFPFEQEEDLIETMNQVERFKQLGATVLLFEFAPLPGSELYQQYKQDLLFSKDNYSFFVLSGLEIVSGDRLRTENSHRRFYELIETYPNIFPGFYHYRNTEILRPVRNRVALGPGNRSKLLNEYDL